MTSAVSADVQRRNAAIEAVIAQVQDARGGGGVAAIELCAEVEGDRASDLDLVRSALAAGVSPADLGPLFVVVLSDLTYEVDWGDHFRFWPVVDTGLKAPCLNLTGDLARRREVAEAFNAFAERYGGVSPVGSFAAQFPLMSRPLVHAMLPRCAQRHVARLLARASAGGVLPESATTSWPVDDLVALGDALGLPLFVRGLLENRSVIEPAGRALLGSAGGESPTWVTRLRRHVRSDQTTRDLIERARENLRTPRSSSRARREAAPKVALSLTEDVPGPTLWVEVAPTGEDEGAVPDLASFARSGALLRVHVNDRKVDERSLFNVIATPLLAPVAHAERQMRLALAPRAYSGEVPVAVAAYFSRAARTAALPLAFRADGAGKFVELPAAGQAFAEGERVAVVVASDDPNVPALTSAGFARSPLGTNVLALIGEARQEGADALARLKLEVRPPQAELVPVLSPPLRREPNRVVFPADEDVWLLLRHAPATAVLRAEALRAGAATPVPISRTEDGTPLLCLAAADLESDASTEVRVFADGQTRALSRLSVVAERYRPAAMEGARWRASLQPPEAGIQHLAERLCWMEVEALPGVSLVIEVEAAWPAGAMQRAERRARPENLANPLATLQLLDGLLDAAGVRSGEAPPAVVTLRARCDDEPEAARLIARVEEGRADLRFEFASGRPTVVCAGGAAELWRLDLGAPGVGRVAAAEGELSTPGVYLAAFEQATTALCVAERSRRVPRLRDVAPPARDLSSLRASLATLRAVDVAELWPPGATANAFFIRRAAARALERALVGSLCGEAWLRAEDEVADRELTWPEALRHLAPLTWLPEGGLGDLLGDTEGYDEPFSLLEGALAAVQGEAQRDAARHLLLVFYRRGLASPRRDEQALRWAWSNRQGARLVRLCHLAVPDAFERWRTVAVEDRGSDG